jgi:hypothetical protein
MEKLVVSAAVVLAFVSATASAQYPPQGPGAECFLSSVGKPVQYSAVQTASLVDTGATDADFAPCLTAGNVVVGAGAVIGGTCVMGTVAAGAAKVARSVGAVGHLPIYGECISGKGVIGTAAASVTVPTTLGHMPIIGSAVADIPLVGPIIAGPPHPVIVGAVAVDTFVLPKVTPGGYTESSMFTMTDFNSPPRLRHYVNYLAPLPYTHPPIYAPAHPDANRLPWQVREELVESTISIEQ